MCRVPINIMTKQLVCELMYLMPGVIISVIQVLNEYNADGACTVKGEFFNHRGTAMLMSLGEIYFMDIHG